MTTSEPTAIAPLPSGSRIVHIGPAKTGTTSVQASMWDARARMDEQGVHYAGGSRHSATAARAGAAIRDVHADDGEPPPDWLWKGVVREIRASKADRVVLSSEFLAHAETPAIRRMANQLDPERIQIAITLRPLARMLTSLWQQGLQTGGHRTLTRWLEANLGREGGSPDQVTRRRVRHDELVRRWSEVVGVDRVTVVVVGTSDHERILRDFEGLLALRPGTMRLISDFANRSMTLPEARALRALNRELRETGLDRVQIRYIVRDGASRVLKLRTPGPDEVRIRLPAWAGERAAEIAAAANERIAASGVRVIGDLSSLTSLPELVAHEEPDDHMVPDDIAASMVMGVAFAAGMMRKSTLLEHERLSEAMELRYLSNRDLIRLPVDRVRRYGPFLLRQRLGLRG